jgi:hypothetical protein
MLKNSVILMVNMQLLRINKYVGLVVYIEITQIYVFFHIYLNLGHFLGQFWGVFGVFLIKLVLLCLMRYYVKM